VFTFDAASILTDGLIIPLPPSRPPWDSGIIREKASPNHSGATVADFNRLPRPASNCQRIVTTPNESRETVSQKYFEVNGFFKFQNPNSNSRSFASIRG
jgi:hypothetical protein